MNKINMELEYLKAKIDFLKTKTDCPKLKEKVKKLDELIYDLMIEEQEDSVKRATVK